MIGQQPATQQVLQSIRCHIQLKTKAPLVLLFSGPSGHGKTELASRMGELLSLEILRIDCTEMNRESDMFGPKAPFSGHENGSPLNNYLAKWAGQKTVIFLDEVGKTNDEVRKSLLLLFESGFYKDHRDYRVLDCSRVIWVLAANLGVEVIKRFWTQHLKDRNQEQQDQAPFERLEMSLQHSVINSIGAPLTGRLSQIVPFLPFDKGE